MQKNGEETIDIKYFTTESTAAYLSTDLQEWFKNSIKESILTQLEEFQEKDSGWTLKSIISLCINMKKYSPIKGTSYIPLPKFIVSSFWLQKSRKTLEFLFRFPRCSTQM
ncbi:uncharacterized protein LOC116417041 [Nasonia vitripennis]|uniref:Uncharacterized protein n=1 Tax=Nasonia vitripennis TaxID=7425 RepID=A0A7M7QB79_NASVI|nr:uncharacterized protein LOC116417041 [Nasonia vitripennis]